MNENIDELLKESIKTYLTAQGFSDILIKIYETVGSTQDIGKRLIEEEAPDRALICAASQTAGRGRYGKSFYSPKDTGIYMSLVLSIKRELSDFIAITFAVAVALRKVIERHSESVPLIKWVNDIWIGDKKAAGILTEGINDLESGMLSYIIIGIGLNCSTETFPEELKDIACRIEGLDIGRNRFIAEIVAEVFSIADELLHGGDKAKKELLKEYKAHSLILGRRVYWEQDGKRYEGKAVDINDDGNLIVCLEDGLVTLSSGEVSVRPM